MGMNISEELSIEEQYQILAESNAYSDTISDSVLESMTNTFVPVMEAYRSIVEAPYLLAQSKLILPFDSKQASKGSVVLLNTTSVKDSISLINSTIVPSMGRYQKYYIDYKYDMKILQKKYYSNNLKSRIPIYTQVEQDTGMIGATTIESCSERNLYFDMHMYNSFYLDRENKFSNINMRIDAYVAIFKKIMSDPRLTIYPTKTMIIDAKSWLPDTGLDKSFIQKQFNNILFIFYYIMLKKPDVYRGLGDIDIVIVGETKAFKINPSKYLDKELILYKRLVNKLLANPVIDIKDEDIVEGEELKTALAKDMSRFQEKYAFTGDPDSNEIDVDDEELNTDREEEDKILDIIDKGASKIEKEYSGSDITKNKLEDAIDTEIGDGKTYKEIIALREKNATGRSTASLKRDDELRKRQSELKVDGLVIGEVSKIPRDQINVERHDVSKKVNTTNRNITQIGFPNFSKTYNEKLYRNDILEIFKSLNDKSIPVYILDINVEDSSTELDLKETWTVKFEDENRVRHTIKVDMPKFIENRFMYLGGNKKVINNQQMMKPVVKTGTDTVQLCSSEYNRKVFITRYGTKSTSDVENFIKCIESTESSNIKMKRGNASKLNLKHDTFFEYDELSKHYTELRVKNGNVDVIFMFNQDDARKMLDSPESNHDSKSYPKNSICFGFSKVGNDTKWTPLWINTDEQVVGGETICKYISTMIGGEFATKFDGMKSGKRAVYSRATIMKKNVPLILLLSYLEGMSTVLRKAKVEYQFLDKKPNYNIYMNQSVVKFADGWLVYNNTPFSNTLLLNGLSELHTEEYQYSDFDTEEIYYDILETLYGRRNIASAFKQFYEFFIGPITKEVLDDYNYPTDFCSLILFANNLLSDNKYIPEMNFNNARIRSSEILVTFLYEGISEAYLSYKNTAYNNNPVKISIPQDYVLKKAMTNQIIENYSKLNPTVELEKYHACTPKGPGGMNLSDAFTLEKRSYDKTMVGTIGMSTSPDANVGVVRSLTLEPKIRNARGYLDLYDDKLDELKDVNLFTPAELLSPLGASRDDATRTAMAVKQSKHVIPVAKTAPVLISNGSEQVIQYHLSNDFVVTAEENGMVVEVNQKAGLIVVEYQPKGKPRYFRAINISKTIDKNGAGGFYLSNQLVYKIKEGDKFEKDDILAYDSKFFSDTLFGNKFCVGSLQKIVCTSEFSTFEDSTHITKKASEDMAAEVVMEKPVVIGRNAHVEKLVKVGDTVLVGDELIVFETSFEEESLNRLLGNIGEELSEEVRSIGKTPVKAKYSGVVEDIQIYSGSDLENLSPSLQGIVGDYWKQLEHKRKVLNKYEKGEGVYKCGYLMNQPNHKIETKDGKIKGEKVDDGVLILIYIKYKDIVGIGDKVTFFTALKGTIGYTIPEGYEPFTLGKPNEEISLCVAPSAVLARMTPSILLTMFGYKVLMGLKDELKKIYEA